jgi:hypothetical protein
VSGTDSPTFHDPRSQHDPRSFPRVIMSNMHCSKVGLSAKPHRYVILIFHEVHRGTIETFDDIDRRRAQAACGLGAAATPKLQDACPVLASGACVLFRFHELHRASQL